MIRQFPVCFALATMVSVAPVPGLVDTAFADSKSRAAVRHDLTEESVEIATTTRSKGRRATRGDSSAGEAEVVQNRGKRSRRNHGGESEETTMIAMEETFETDLVTLAETEADAIAKHIRSGSYEGQTGMLAKYLLTGKAAAGMPMTHIETKALEGLVEAKTLSTIIDETEAQLVDISGDRTTLDAISAALGIPRPTPEAAKRSSLGASLQIQSEDSSG